jgi:hypothetical protein
MAVSNNVDSNVQNQIIEEQIRQQQVQQQNAIAPTENNDNSQIASTETQTTPITDAGANAKIGELNAQSDVRKADLNQQADVLIVAANSSNTSPANELPIINLPNLSGTDGVALATSKTIKSIDIPSRNETAYKEIIDLENQRSFGIPRITNNQVYASMSSNAVVQNAVFGDNFDSPANALAKSFMARDNDKQFAAETFKELGAKGLVAALSEGDESIQDYTTKSIGKDEFVSKHEVFRNLLDGMVKENKFGEGDMYLLAKTALDINTAQRPTADEYLKNETKNEGFVGLNNATKSSITKLDEFFTDSSRPQLKAMWENGLGLAVKEKFSEGYLTSESQVLVAETNNIGNLYTGQSLGYQLDKLQKTLDKKDVITAFSSYILTNPGSAAMTISDPRATPYQKSLIINYLNSAFDSKTTNTEKAKLVGSLAAGIPGFISQEAVIYGLDRTLGSVAGDLGDVIKNTKNENLMSLYGTSAASVAELYRKDKKEGSANAIMASGLHAVADNPNAVQSLFQYSDFKKEVNFKRESITMLGGDKRINSAMGRALASASKSYALTQGDAPGTDIFLKVAEQKNLDKDTLLGLLSYYRSNRADVSFREKLSSNFENQDAMASFFGQTYFGRSLGDETPDSFELSGKILDTFSYTMNNNKTYTNSQGGSQFAGYLRSIVDGANIGTAKDTKSKELVKSVVGSIAKFAGGQFKAGGKAGEFVIDKLGEKASEKINLVLYPDDMQKNLEVMVNTIEQIIQKKGETDEKYEQFLTSMKSRTGRISDRIEKGK